MRFLLSAFYLGSFMLDAFLNCSGNSATPTPVKSMSFEYERVVYDATANLHGSTSPDSILVSTYAPQAAPTPSLGLNLKFPKAVGTYNLSVAQTGSADFTTYVYGANTQSSTIERYYAGTKAGRVYGSGTVTVDSYSDGLVSGTFNFTAQSLSSGASKTITDGKFTLHVGQ